jgi:hypothetical protein
MKKRKLTLGRIEEKQAAGRSILIWEENTRYSEHTERKIKWKKT